MILTSMPDLPPRPLTTANAAFRDMFYRRWGRETCLVSGASRDVRYETHPQTLSIKAAWGGRERYFLREREVAVDDDHWLLLNDGRAYGSEIRGERPVTSFSIFFAPGLPEQVAADCAQSLASQLDAPNSSPRGVEYDEHLRPHGDSVSRRLRVMHADARAGECSEDWLETQALLLLGELQGAARSPDTARRSLQVELRRRLRLAADFIDTCHAEPLALADMARVACLSRYHFVRHFRALFGITPYAYLLRKRARVARRLMEHGRADRERIALAVGFANRFALARALSRHVAD
jgi:AraC family transcriptional regulator